MSAQSARSWSGWSAYSSINKKNLQKAPAISLFKRASPPFLQINAATVAYCAIPCPAPCTGSCHLPRRGPPPGGCGLADKAPLAQSPPPLPLLWPSSPLPRPHLERQTCDRREPRRIPIERDELKLAIYLPKMHKKIFVGANYHPDVGHAAASSPSLSAITATKQIFIRIHFQRRI